MLEYAFDVYTAVYDTKSDTFRIDGAYVLGDMAVPKSHLYKKVIDFLCLCVSVCVIIDGSFNAEYCKK